MGINTPFMSNKDEKRALCCFWNVNVPPDKLVLRLQAETKRAVRWLADVAAPGQIACTPIVGASGQIVIWPTDRLHPAWEKVGSSVSTRGPEFGDDRSAWFDIVRLQAASTLVTVSLEGGGRVAIYLSETLADAKIGPGRGEDATIIAVGDVLEVWRRDVWNEWLLESGKRIGAIEKGALEAIVRRAD